MRARNIVSARVPDITKSALKQSSLEMAAIGHGVISQQQKFQEDGAFAVGFLRSQERICDLVTSS